MNDNRVPEQDQGFMSTKFCNIHLVNPKEFPHVAQLLYFSFMQMKNPILPEAIPNKPVAQEKKRTETQYPPGSISSGHSSQQKWMPSNLNRTFYEIKQEEIRKKAGNSRVSERIRMEIVQNNLKRAMKHEVIPEESSQMLKNDGSRKMLGKVNVNNITSTATTQNTANNLNPPRQATNIISNIQSHQSSWFSKADGGVLDTSLDAKTKTHDQKGGSTKHSPTGKTGNDNLKEELSKEVSSLLKEIQDHESKLNTGSRPSPQLEKNEAPSNNPLNDPNGSTHTHNDQSRIEIDEDVIYRNYLKQSKRLLRNLNDMFSQRGKVEKLTKQHRGNISGRDMKEKIKGLAAYSPEEEQLLRNGLSKQLEHHNDIISSEVPPHVPQERMKALRRGLPETDGELFLVETLKPPHHAQNRKQIVQANRERSLRKARRRDLTEGDIHKVATVQHTNTVDYAITSPASGTTGPYAIGPRYTSTIGENLERDTNKISIKKPLLPSTTLKSKITPQDSAPYQLAPLKNIASGTNHTAIAARQAGKSVSPLYYIDKLTDEREYAEICNSIGRLLGVVISQGEIDESNRSLMTLVDDMRKFNPLFVKFSVISTVETLKNTKIMLFNNQIIYAQGQKIDTAYIILYGKVYLSSRELGHVKECYMGESICEEALVEPGLVSPRWETAKAIHKTGLIEISKKSYEKLRQVLNDKGYKSDFLILQSNLVRNLQNKRNMLAAQFS